MNYRESKPILELIRKSKRILLNCHRSPDPDSIGCALAMYQVLESMGKEVSIICPTEPDKYVNYLPDFEKIKKVDFSTFDYSAYDLFIVVDTSTWGMTTDSKVIPIFEIPIVFIDHHKINQQFGSLNLIDSQTTSCGEILYLMFEDWGIKIDKEIAGCLMAAILGDTGVFRYHGVTKRTLEIAGQLIDCGVSLHESVFNIFGSLKVEMLKFFGKALSEVNIDKEGSFAWVAITNEDFIKYGSLPGGKELTASMFMGLIKGTAFGIIMVEIEKNLLSISLRSRTGVDTSKIAKELGGGGHIYASGARISGLPFKEAVEKVLQVARKYAR